MSYYMGDFYRGDPGIGSFLGGIFKKAVSFIPGVGPIASTVMDAVMPGGAKTVAARAPVAAGAITAAAGNIASKGRAVVRSVGGTIMKHPVLSAAGAAGALGAAGVATGMHMGKASARAAAGLGRKHRRMNSCNPRALRRAARRLHSFAKHYRKAVGFVSPHPKKGRMYFKARRKKA